MIQPQTFLLNILQTVNIILYNYFSVVLRKGSEDLGCCEATPPIIPTPLPKTRVFKNCAPSSSENVHEVPPNRINMRFSVNFESNQYSQKAP